MAPTDLISSLVALAETFGVEFSLHHHGAGLSIYLHVDTVEDCTALAERLGLPTPTHVVWDGHEYEHTRGGSTGASVDLSSTHRKIACETCAGTEAQ